MKQLPVVPGSVEEYIHAFPLEVRGLLEDIRRTIRAAAPGAVESISYQIPAFKLDGRPLVYFAAWKRHIALYPIPSGPAAFEREIALYLGAKSTARFPLAKPVPLALVEEIVRLRRQEIQEEKRRAG